MACKTQTPIYLGYIYTTTRPYIFHMTSDCDGSSANLLLASFWQNDNYELKLFMYMEGAEALHVYIYHCIT